MKEITPSRLKELQLGILDTVAEFCTAHGINYWLNAGTLLGAVRHRGYIPWDDDVDLAMLRRDYDKFMAEFNGSNSRYKFVCYENDPESFTHFGKVLDTSTVLYEPDEKGEKLSVYIDIFPMDNAPDDVSARERMFRRRNVLYVCNLGRKLPVFLTPTRGGILRRLCVYAFRGVLRVFPRYYFVKALVRNAKRFAGADTEYFGDFTGTHNAAMRRDLAENITRLEFEGKKYNAPAGYEEWLRKLFGDYMRLPAPEKRASTHFFRAYELD